MPEIIKEDKQVKALSQIEGNLATLKSINVALMSEGTYTIVATREGKSVKIPIDAREGKRITSILTAERARLVKESKALAEKNRILFSDADRVVLDGAVVEKKLIVKEEPGDEMVGEKTAEDVVEHEIDDSEDSYIAFNEGDV